jgi:hypothetical protein
MLAEGIDSRIQDIEYKFRLAQQDFAREVKYGGFPMPNISCFIHFPFLELRLYGNRHLYLHCIDLSAAMHLKQMEVLISSWR